MANVLALIPARAGSKGVINKNIRLLAGHPLLAWSVRACLTASEVSRVIVSTDSTEYSSIARQYGAEAPFLRPNEISQDTSTDYEFINHALEFLEKNDELPDFIAHIRPTTPLRRPSVINDAIKVFMQEKDATALRSVHEMSESAYKCFEIDMDGNLKLLGSSSRDLDKANNARQSYPSTYNANGYVDILSVPFIRSHAAIHGSSVRAFVTEPVVEVDTRNDFDYIEYQISKETALVDDLFK